MSYKQHSKTLGQVFLHDKNIVHKIVNLTQKHMLTYEIGCGKGILTEALSNHASSVHVIEIDHRWIEWVEKKQLPNITFHHKDVLTFTDFKPNSIVIANIPYHITTPIIEHLIQYKHRLSSITIMVQKEVAQRIISNHNCKNYGLLSIYCQYHFNIDKGFIVSRNCFTPMPNVDSQIISLQPKESALSPSNESLFFLFAKSLFWGRRKTIETCLKKAPYIRYEADISKHYPELRKRGESFSLTELLNLFNKLKSNLSPVRV